MNKQNWIKLLAILLAATMSIGLASCGDDEETVVPPKDKLAGEISDEGNADIVVVVNEDGTTSNGSIFFAIDDKNYYIDYVKYTVKEGYLEVTGYDKTDFKGLARIISKLKYKGNTYEVLKIGNKAFYDCSSLTSITIPNSVTSIGWGAFSDCYHLTSITIPNSVTSIGDFAFYNCTRLTSITIPNSVTSIGRSAFENCSSLTSITIPNSVTSIGESAFQGCTRLTSITIPNSVTSIGGYAFSYCTSLTSITIPNSVTSIGDYVFYDCTRLTTVKVKRATPPEISSSTFNNANATLYVPFGSKYAYQAAEGWKEFKQIMETNF